MAYQFASASSQYLSTSTTPVTAAPMTISCWSNHGTYVTNRALVSIETGTTTSIFLFYIGNDANLYFFVQNSAGTFGQSGGGLIVPTDSWNHCAAVTSASNSRLTYLNGNPSTTDTTNIVPSDIAQIKIGARKTTGSVDLLNNGLIADVGIWNVALTVAEIVSLRKGMACDKVRPQSLVFYAPLARDLIDVRGGRAITNNNTATVANHTRIYQ